MTFNMFTLKSKVPVRPIKAGLSILLFVALVFIWQRASVAVYDLGLILVIAIVFLGFTFNNISNSTTVGKLALSLIITWIIVGAIFGISIAIAPLLATLGR